MPRLNRDNLTLAACAICVGIILGVFLVFPIWAPSWMSDFGANRGLVMLIYSASGILMTLTMPVAGWLLIRQPAWRVIVLGAVIMGGGAILASMVKAYLPFAIVYTVAMGLGAGLAGIIPCQSLAVRLFPRHVGAISGLLIVALAASGVVFPLLLIPFKIAVGWRTALAATGALVLIFIPLLAFAFMREPAPRGAALTADPHAGVTAGANAAAKRIVRTGRFWIILGGIFPLMAAPTAVQANLLTILADHGVGQRDAGFVLSGLAIGSAMGAVLFGWLADRADPRVALGGAAILMAGALIVFATSGGLPAAAGAAAILGLASGGILPLLSIFAFRQFPSAYAPALGLLGLIRDWTGSYSLAFLAAAPVLILGAANIWRLKPAPTTAAPMPLHPPAAQAE